MTVNGDSMYTGIGMKLLILTFMVIGLQIPVLKIDRLLGERVERRNEAEGEIHRMAGGSQVLRGPVLQVDSVHESQETDGNGGVYTKKTASRNTVLPSTMSVTSAVIVEPRSRGMFSAQTYVTQVTFTGSFSINETVLPQYVEQERTAAQGVVSLAISEPRFIREISKAEWGSEPLAFTTTTKSENETQTISAKVALQPQTKVPFTVTLKLSGSGALRLIPSGRTWTASMTSNAKDPSFIGELLPTKREVTGDGFSASWEYGGVLRSAILAPNAEISSSLADGSIGVSLLPGIDSYRMTERALKYNPLFLFLTFLTFFTFEIVSRLRVHPMQYLLVGCAITLFYLLLLSFSEHIGFGRAYATAAISAVGLIAAYSCTTLKQRRRAGAVGTLLGSLYLYLYALLIEGDFALLSGSIGLTVALGVVMYLTRRVDWYSLGTESLKPELYSNQNAAQTPINP